MKFARQGMASPGWKTTNAASMGGSKRENASRWIGGTIAGSVAPADQADPRVVSGSGAFASPGLPPVTGQSQARNQRPRYWRMGINRAFAAGSSTAAWISAA